MNNYKNQKALSSTGKMEKVFMDKAHSLVLFNRNTVRRHWNEDKEIWYFSVVDVVEVLTDSTIPRRYWSDLKAKLQAEGSEVYEKIVQLKMPAPDGKSRRYGTPSHEDTLEVNVEFGTFPRLPADR